MPSAPRLIEVALPLDAINKASAREKSIRHGHPSTLHLWWARRPLAAARAVLFTSLVPDPDPDNPAVPRPFLEACLRLPLGDYSKVKDTPRNRLFDFIATLVTWESTTDEQVISKARELIRLGCEGEPPPVLDPFAGGGSIPLEAQRLGLSAHASDLNPVAVLINKAMIEIPPMFAGQAPVNPRDHKPGTGGDARWKGAAGLAADVRYYGEWMRERAQERIGHLYPQHKGETVIAWLWARTVQSPNPAVRAEVPLVNSFALSKKKGREFRVEPIVERLDGADDGPTHRVRFKVRKGLPPKDYQGTMKRMQGGVCAVSGAPIPFDYIREEGKAGRLGAQLMAIVTEGNRGRNYHSSNDEQELIANGAEPAWLPEGNLPEKALGFRVQLYGMKAWADLFTPRQLVALTTFSDLVAEARQQIEKDAIAAGLAEDGVSLRHAGRGGQMLQRSDGVRGSNQRLPEYGNQPADQQNEREFTMEHRRREGRAGLWQTGNSHDVELRRSKPVFEFDGKLERDNRLDLESVGESARHTAGVGRSTRCGAHAYADAVTVNLSLGVSRLTNRLSSNCIWNTSRDTIEQVFGRQAIPMVWSFAEANPFSSSSGNFIGQLDYLVEVLEGLPGMPQANVTQGDASSLNTPDSQPVTTLSTDPPYYDNIGYADLSDFFYVWLRRSLREVYPELFSTLLVPKSSELIVAPHRHNDKLKAKSFFETGMLDTFTSLRNQVRDDYPISIYYAYKQQDTGIGEDRPSSGWETMLTSLIEAGFQIIRTWPLRTERPTGLKKRTNSLATSIILVCRVRPDCAKDAGRRDFSAALRRELPAALKQLLSGNLAATDLAQGSIGPGMAIFSRYSHVLEPDGREMSVRVALGLINRALDDFFAEQDGELDAETRFAIAWFEKYAFAPGPFGDADVLARARNTSVASVALAGLVEAGAGQVTLLQHKQYSDWKPQEDKRPTIWEGTHHLIRCLQLGGGEAEAGALLRDMKGNMPDEAKRLAYRLYNVCERTRRNDHARDYNALVDSWPEIVRLANDQVPQQTVLFDVE